MKNVEMFVKLMVSAIMVTGLTACGATFVKGGTDPLKSGERIGVLITSHRVSVPTAFSTNHISDKVDEEAVEKGRDALQAEFTKKGFTPVFIPASARTAELVKKYNALPRDFRRVEGVKRFV